jgi:hypothetical protein
MRLHLQLCWCTPAACHKTPVAPVITFPVTGKRTYKVNSQSSHMPSLRFSKKSWLGSSLISLANFLGLSQRLLQEPVLPSQIRARCLSSKSATSRIPLEAYIFCHFPCFPSSTLHQAFHNIEIIGLHSVKICMALPYLIWSSDDKLYLESLIFAHGNCVYVNKRFVVRNKRVHSRLTPVNIVCNAYLESVSLTASALIYLLAKLPSISASFSALYWVLFMAVLEGFKKYPSHLSELLA